MQLPRPDRWLLPEAVPLLLVLLAAALVLGSSMPRFPFFGDEGRYIYNTRFFDYVVLQRDLARSGWGDNYWTHNHPKLTVYLLGAWLRAAGYRQEHSPLPYDWSERPDANRAEGRVPDRPLLLAARAPMVALAVATMAALYLVGRFLAGRVSGLAAAALALASPLTREILVRVPSDVPLVLFVLLLPRDDRQQGLPTCRPQVDLAASLPTHAPDAQSQPRHTRHPTLNTHVYPCWLDMWRRSAYPPPPVHRPLFPWTSLG